MHSLLKRGGKVKMTTTLLETYSIALEGTSDLNRRILKENRELQAEVKRLKGVLDMDSSLDDAIIKDAERMRELKAEIKSLKADAVKHYPKEYKAEADEYFSHNPKSKYVAFYMLSEYDIKDGEGGDLMLYKDDALIIIDNDNS